MSHIIKKFTVLIVVLATACNDSFLESDLIRATDETNFYATEGEVFGGLVAAYDPLQWSFAGGRWSSAIMLGEIRSDNANAGGDPTNNDQPGWQMIDDLSADQTLGESDSFWRKNYTGIRRANLVIYQGDLGTAATDQYVAEAKFLRAFYHFELFRMFGPVPVIDFLVTPEDYSLTRNTMTEVFTLITNDLQEAIPLLPFKSTLAGTDLGRATRGAAQGLLGKAYLYWADWDNDDAAKFDLAAEQFEAVINSGEYGLLDDFSELYAFRNKFSNESVFEIQHSNLETIGWEWADGISGNMIVQLCGIRGLCTDNTDYVAGWGFMLPTQDLWDSFLSDDVYRRSSAIISQTELSTAGCNVTESEQNAVDFEGYWQKKFANYAGYDAPLGGDLNTVKDANEIYMRYADILLMSAEALVRGSGSAATAEARINEVRERAHGPGDNTGTYRTAAQLISSGTFSTLLDVIKYERRAEFAGEGDRWFDLVRRGEFSANTFDGTDNIRRSNFTEEDNFLPISQLESDRTNGSLTIYPEQSLFQ